MSALEMQTLDWIARAPFKVEAHAESAASPEKVFAVLADHEHWPEWFPMVRKVTVVGDEAEGVGARRRVHVLGMSFEEEFIAWDPGARWTFSVYEARPRFTRSLVEDCMLAPLPNGGTSITYTMYMDPVGPTGFFMKLGVGRMRANNTKGLRNLAVRAAR